MDPVLELCLTIVAKNDRYRIEDEICLFGKSLYPGILQIKNVQPLIERQLTVIYYAL